MKVMAGVPYLNQIEVIICLTFMNSYPTLLSSLLLIINNKSNKKNKKKHSSLGLHFSGYWIIRRECSYIFTAVN